MTSLPCPLPGRDNSNVVFPDLAPAPSVVAAYPLGLSPETAASPYLPYSQSYGHLLSFLTLGQQPQETHTCPASNSRQAQPFHRPAEHPQQLEEESEEPVLCLEPCQQPLTRQLCGSRTMDTSLCSTHSTQPCPRRLSWRRILDSPKPR